MDQIELFQKSYKLFWSPTGQLIDVVRAKSSKEAIRKAPGPYRKYLGEIYTEEVKHETRQDSLSDRPVAVGVRY